MTPEQDKLLRQIAADAKEARRQADIARRRGEVNTRAILLNRSQDTAGLQKVLAEIAALDKEK